MGEAFCISGDTSEELLQELRQAALEESPDAGLPELTGAACAALVLPDRSDIGKVVSLIMKHEPQEKKDEEYFSATSWEVPAGTQVVNSWSTPPRGPIGDFREVTVLRLPEEHGSRARVVWGYRTAFSSRIEFMLDTTSRRFGQSARAERKAQRKLRSLVTEDAFARYVLSDNILEKSERSGVHYVIRKNHPTLAYAPVRDGKTRFLAALCLHPLGYYADSFAGILVPTDEVIAHLLMIRADERRYWAKAGQHRPPDPRAGI